MSEIVSRLNRALSGRYLVEHQLGEGGMATVHLAKDLRHDRKVALKVLRPEVAAAVGVERFLSEIRTTANLQHPHILPLFDSGEADGLAYYVMPYVDGESLRDRLQRVGALPVGEAVRIAIAVCRALEHAHGRGIIHRDIKPANILFQDGEPIVGDFGIALAVHGEGGDRFTATGLAIGSVQYMSPEQATGDTGVDGRTDVYALGCVLYEMLSGEAPFGRGSAQAILGRKVTRRVRDLVRGLESVPGTVTDVIERALAVSPEDRFPTAVHLRNALSQATAEEAMARRASRIRRTRAVRGLGIVAVTAVLGSTGWWGWTSVTGPSVERLSVLPPMAMTSAPDQEPMLQGMHNGLINELSRAGVSVIGGVQSMTRYRDSDLTVREIADELRVDAIVEWGGYWSGDSVGFDVRLLDGDTQDVLWANSYGDQVDQLVNLYRAVTAAVAHEIELDLTPEARARLARVQSVDPEAQEAYMRAQFHWNRMTPEDFDQALAYLDAALTEDPGYAEAYAGRAWIRVAQQQLGILPPDQATPLAVAAKDSGLLLDSASPEVQYARGAVGWAAWDWEEAEEGYRRAIELNPNLALARADYSHLLSVTGRPAEALAQIERAVEIEPLNLQVMVFRGTVLLFNRRYEDALAQMGRVVEMVPNNRVALSTMWAASYALGNEEEAVGNAARFLTAAGLTEATEALTSAYAEEGYREAFSRAADVTARLAQERFVAPLTVARVHRAAGRYDEVLDWLERAVDSREPNSPYLAVTQEFDPLRTDPRFRRLLDEMGLPSR
ncbi:MAG TPA: protein kinase [Longimicrobiales bacterium]|nr:protein kinase [Longimicrobiales bacterium]